MNEALTLKGVVYVGSSIRPLVASHASLFPGGWMVSDGEEPEYFEPSLLIVFDDPTDDLAKVKDEPIRIETEERSITVWRCTFVETDEFEGTLFDIEMVDGCFGECEEHPPWKPQA